MNSCVEPSLTSQDRAARPRWPAAGDKMRFLGKNGYDAELERALDTFEIGAVLTVKDCRVGGWEHSVAFEGVQGRWNGVMFELLTPGKSQDGSPPQTPSEQNNDRC